MAKDKKDERRIDFEIEQSELNPEDVQYEMFIQGERIAIPRGKEVQVKPIVKDIYRETTALAKKANKSNKELVVFKNLS